MNKEEKPTDDQIQELEELRASLKQDDYISKRKKLNIREGISGFLISFFIVSFLSVILYWSGAIQQIDFKLVSFCMLVGIFVAVIESMYLLGRVYNSVLLILSCIISWFIIYGIFI